MLKVINKNIVISNYGLYIAYKLFASFLLAAVTIAVIFMIIGGYCYPAVEGDSYANEWQKFVKIVLRNWLFFYTCQSNLVLGIYAFSILLNYKKQSLIGIVALGNMSIVCMFFWIGYGMFSFDFNWNIFINIASVLNHGINLIIAITVFLIRCIYVHSAENHKFQSLCRYFFIIPSFFIICDLIMNFVPFFAKDGQAGYSPYGFISAINPKIPEGEIWHVIFIPLFYLLVLLMCSFFYYLNTIKRSMNIVDNNNLYIIERKVNAFSSVIIVIVSLISYILLFLAQIFISKADFAQKSGVTGWIYGALLSMYFFILFISFYNSIKYRKFKNEFGVIKLFSSISLYYLSYIGLIYLMLILSYFNIYDIDKYFNPYISILVFGNFYFMLAFANFFIWFYSSFDTSIKIDDNKGNVVVSNQIPSQLTPTQELKFI